MEDTKKKLFHVKFMPDERTGVVPSGSTILEAANNAGVYLSSVCGGEGLCGKCRVIVLHGRVNMKPNSLLDREEIQKGYVIACLTEVLSDLRVEVPLETRLEGRPKFDTEHSYLFGPPIRGKISYPRNPLCRKLFLKLSKPSLTDNLSDLDRVTQGINRVQRLPIYTGLKTLQTLPSLLRDSDFNVTVTLADRTPSIEVVQFEPGDTTGSNYGIAVDIGTTTVMANMINLKNGMSCGTSADYNSQIRFGEDVISRIVYTQENKNGLQELNNVIVKDINNLALTLIEQCNTPLHDVNYMVCAGNTTMIHILLGIELASIRKEPYIPVASKPPIIRASDVGIKISPGGRINCLPGVGAYVGSDITAGILASGIAQEESLSLLIDIGTNGEIVLGIKDLLICCSASAGPAFEGAGTQCGMRATNGAIEKVRIHDDGSVLFDTIGDDNVPRGICGSGLIDLVAEIFYAGILDRKGRFIPDNRNPHLREGNDGIEFLLVEKGHSGAKRDIVITEADIATFIRTKGAIYTAAEALLWQVGYSWSDVERVYISGGFGKYIDIRRAIIIGLLPDLPIEKFQFIGNGSITGAQMCLLSRAAFQEAVRIVERMTYFDLSTDPWFMREYTASLFLPHTDLKKFPTVAPPEVQ